MVFSRDTSVRAGLFHFNTLFLLVLHFKQQKTPSQIHFNARGSQAAMIFEAVPPNWPKEGVYQHVPKSNQLSFSLQETPPLCTDSTPRNVGNPGVSHRAEIPFFEPALRSQAGVFWVMYVISCLQGLIKGPLHHGCDGMEP